MSLTGRLQIVDPSKDLVVAKQENHSSHEASKCVKVTKSSLQIKYFECEPNGIFLRLYLCVVGYLRSTSNRTQLYETLQKVYMKLTKK